MAILEIPSGNFAVKINGELYRTDVDLSDIQEINSIEFICDDGYIFNPETIIDQWGMIIYDDYELSITVDNAYREVIYIAPVDDEPNRAIIHSESVSDLNKLIVNGGSALVDNIIEGSGGGGGDKEILIESFDLVKLRENHVEMYRDGAKVEGETTPLYKGELFELHCHNGYEFVNDVADHGDYQQYGENTLLLYASGSYGGYWNFRTIERDNFKTAIIEPSWADASFLSEAYMDEIHVFKSGGNEVAGLNNVYLLDDDKLREITRARFIQGSVEQGNVIDYGQYILNLMQLPFLVEDFETSEELVYLATHNTNVTAPSLEVDKLTVDLGVIVTPRKFGDFRDYLETKTTLYLPYADSIELLSSDVIGHSVRVEYIINCYNGVGTINVYSDSVDGLIASKTTNFGFNIPLANINNDPQSFGANSVDYSGYNDIRSCYIEVSRSNVVDFEGGFNIPVIDSGKLSTFDGYVEVNNVTVYNSHAMNDYERNLLENVLKNGVYLND